MTTCISFKDCCVRIKKLNISYTYKNWLEGHPSLLSRIIVKEEKETKTDGYLFLEPSLPEGARLGNYRFELEIDSCEEEYYYSLTLVFFEEIQGLNLHEIINAKTKYINFRDIAQKISWDVF